MYKFLMEISMQEFFSARIWFSPGILPRFCFPAEFSPGSWKRFFSWLDPGEYRFLGEILAEMRGRNFSRVGSGRQNGPPWWDPSECQESWWDPGGFLVPILQGLGGLKRLCKNVYINIKRGKTSF